MTTTPYTEMLAVYKACPRGLTAAEPYVERFLASPDELASLFALSVAQFSRYSNIDEPFHEAPLAPKFGDAHGVTVERTVDIAKRLADAGVCVVNDPGGFEFTYVDRELDVMRTSTMQLLDNGAESKRALLLDLLLRRADGTPVLTELKIERDTHAVYALVQVLAAAAHLVTPAQRTRLAKIYAPHLKVPLAGPYVDLAVLLVEKPATGKGATLLSSARELASALMQRPQVSGFIGAFHFLVADDFDASSLVFRRV